jgi:predicted nuclease of predicted toxin-antitoxin system
VSAAGEPSVGSSDCRGVTLWIDAQLSPALARWFHEALEVTAIAVRDLQLRDATDPVIFQAAREANAVVLTKDDDFVRLVERRGPPPQVVWLTCGNTSNAVVRHILERSWPAVSMMLARGEPVIEITGAIEAAS